MQGISARLLAPPIFLFLFSFPICSQPSSTNSFVLSKYKGQRIWDLPKIPEEEVDVGLWALIVAKEFDHSVDIPKYLSLLDSYVLEIKRMLAGRTSDRDKFAATRMFIYESGIWNGHRPFDYNLEDPTGENLSTQLVSSYLDSRKGNCVSMPTLFYALMQRLDASVPVSVLHAPLHLFCRVKDRQTGDVWNFEATNGTTARNVWIIESLNIPQKGIESGIYMKELSKKEFLAALVNILAHKQRKQGNFSKALKYTNLALKLNPNDIIAIVNKCALNSELGWPLHLKKERGEVLTEAERKLYDKYASVAARFEKKAFSLGWRPETKEQQEKYLQLVKEELERRSNNK